MNSEVSVETSRSGAPVLRKDGRYLGSSVDPLGEARRWAEACMSEVKDVKAIIIFGIGSGYHVRTLMQLMPEVSFAVLERDADLAREALRVVPEIPRHLVIVEADWARCLERVPLRVCTRSMFKIFKHQPSYDLHRDFYDRAEMLLLARDRTGFLQQLRDRPQLLRVLDSETIEQMANAPVTVKTILTALKSSQSDEAGEREALLWRALGELIR